VKICDLTQFYSPVSGGVKRYVAEKVRYMRTHCPGDEHVLIIPGEKDSVETGRVSRLYTIRSPLVSKTSRYRVLLRLEAVERILEKERPDLIESGDPYQVAWKAVYSGAALGIPVIGFYHSHFPEAYLRSVQKFLGVTATEFVLDLAKRYIRKLYNRFERTLVPSPALGDVLESWGVRNVFETDLGVNTEVFRLRTEGVEDERRRLGIPNGPKLLLYVGRLAFEKNTQTLFNALELLAQRNPGRYHLLVVGDGLQRPELAALMQRHPGTVTHLPYCKDSELLARIYRAADLFVHPGVQETFGLVALEAQACGTPVLGVRGSYMDRIIHHPQIHWAAANSASALAGAIHEICKEDLPALGREAAQTVSARYSWEQVFSRLFDLYREVIANYRRPE
jgi:alpha-1,6-mannosyltransferase